MFKKSSAVAFKGEVRTVAGCCILGQLVELIQSFHGGASCDDALLYASLHLAKINQDKGTQEEGYKAGTCLDASEGIKMEAGELKYERSRSPPELRDNP